MSISLTVGTLTAACGDGLLFQSAAEPLCSTYITTSAMTRPESRPLLILKRPLYTTKATILDNAMTAMVVPSLSLHKSFFGVQKLSPQQQSRVK